MRQFELEALCQTCPPFPPGLTLAGGHRVVKAPFAIGLAVDDPLASVVVARVTDEHQLGLELVLRLKDEPPSTVFHTDGADVRIVYSIEDAALAVGEVIYDNYLFPTLHKLNYGMGTYVACTACYKN